MILPPSHSGFLIAIEGIDGAGKTTQAQLLHDALQSLGIPVVRTKEPTSGKWGQMLRDSAVTGRLSLAEEVEAFIKDRQEHVQTLILPSLEAGKVVIVDRYYFSTAAYQGAIGFDPAELLRRNEAFAPEPDLLVLLDLDPNHGLTRIRTRGDLANHFEKADTLTKARDIFLSVQRPYRYTIDATLEVGEIHRRILNQMRLVQAERIAHSGTPLRDQLNATLALFGERPLSD